MEELFFELLQVAVGNRKRLSRRPRPEEWESLIDTACRQTVAGVCSDGIGRLPESQRPPRSIAMRWAVMTLGIERQNRKLNRQAVELQGKFLAAGFRSCIFKGQGVAAAYYPAPLHRQSGDIDIWLEGGRKEIISYIRGMSPTETVSYHHIDFKALKDPAVEVHFFPSYLNNPFRNHRLLAWWREEADRQMGHLTEQPGGAGFITTLTDDMNLIALLAHIQHHFFEEGIGMRQLMDYYYLLAKGIDEDTKAETRRRLEHFGMTKFAGAVMYVLQTVFGMSGDMLLLPSSEKTGRPLLHHIMQAGNFGHYDKNVSYIYETGTPLMRFLRRGCVNLRFIRQYPGEYLAGIYFRVFYYFYRKRWN